MTFSHLTQTLIILLHVTRVVFLPHRCNMIFSDLSTMLCDFLPFYTALPRTGPCTLNGVIFHKRIFTTDIATCLSTFQFSQRRSQRDPSSFFTALYAKLWKHRDWSEAAPVSLHSAINKRIAHGVGVPEIYA